MNAKLMALIAFAGDDSELDVDRAADELRLAGYEVFRLPAKYGGRLLIPLDDFIEVHVEGPDDTKIIHAVMDEINAIVDPCGGCCMECGAIERDHVQFAELFEDADRVPVQ